MTSSPSVSRWLPFLLLGFPALAGCPTEPDEPQAAEGIYAPMGEIRPSATDEEREAFERGREVALRRFAPEDGLGPTMNVTFCASCHESPVVGGSAPRYRDFYLTAELLGDGSFLPKGKGGVLTNHGLAEQPRHTPIDPDVNVITRRNAIPFFGVGLIAELPEDVILEHVDEDDADGDGISGRANYDRGFVGRFGRKAQTVSIEGFIRGPLFNHLGLTSDPLSEEDKGRLPVPSSTIPSDTDGDLLGFRQAAAPDEPLFDDDDVPDPELSSEDLFDLVSFAMLLGVPEPDEPTDESEAGRARFVEIGCADCHVPTLVGPRGPLPLYSDLLLHDMGDELADGFMQGLAEGNEFRTQPLWGVAATRPYLHDGRADTLHEAILWHGGEGEQAREAYAELDETAQAEVLAFLESLGGADQKSDGLLPPDAPIPAAGEPGAPLGGTDLTLWERGRLAFDRDARLSEGLGPLFNGDSCRACHFEPVLGGAGPRGLDVMRHGTTDDMGEFTAPDYGTILPRLTTPGAPRPEPLSGHNTFENRQTPSLLGMGLIEGIPDDEIMALADPDDLDGDGIRGVAHVMGDGRLARFGWKAQVPSVREFVRDAGSAELGLTVPEEDGFTFGFLSDGDEVADPEMSVEQIDDIAYFIGHLDAPAPAEEVPGGLELFESVGCDDCHVPELPGADGPVPLYSDLLLHVVAPDGVWGIADGMATTLQFRTPPLWGLRGTAPYMHDGSASTVLAAIQAHDGEANASREAFEALGGSDRALLIEFLEAL